MTLPGLGGQQSPPLNASPAAQLVPGVQAGVSGQIVARRVVIIGAGGELLVYSPTAAAGNLITSVAGATFTDPYGNQGLAGTADYSNALNVAVQMFGGAVRFYFGSLSGGWTQGGTVSGDSTGSVFLTPNPSSELVGLEGGHTQLIASASQAIPASTAGITTVAGLITFLQSVGIST